MVNIGHYVDRQGQSVFRVFAPEKQQLSVELIDRGERIPLVSDDIGYWQVTLPRLDHGTRYWLWVDDQRLPDPASRCQPQGVHGPSMVVDIEAVESSDWSGVPIEEAIIYELHVGTFTEQGTLRAAAERLSYLQQLGVTVIELMPLAAFPGQRNWGYDGVFHFALHNAYGSYRDLKAFIEQAHELGLAVILDVVYNHFGPEGNYSGFFAPYTKQADTPWGAAINFDEAYNHGIRDYFLQNTRYWLETMGFDGLRMDAVSLIFDNMPTHILREITDLARQIGSQQQRQVLMIAEHLRNDCHVTSSAGFNYHAQWNDDVNYALFALLTGERTHHCQNFGAFADVVKALQVGFVRDGSRFDKYLRYFMGTSGSATQPAQHVVHMQDHDQVGNRVLGDRMCVSYGQEKALLATTAIFAAPFTPMLWMGEEYGEQAPFWFFEDFSDQHIIDGVREGRKAEFSFSGQEVYDPHAESTFTASRLQWQRLEQPLHQQYLAYYRTLIALKKKGWLGPRDWAAVTVTADDEDGVIRITSAQTITLLNFSDQPQPLPAELQGAPVLAHSQTGYNPLPADGAVVLATPAQAQQTR